ncbi:MAG TPA: hypothetical protein VNO70_17795, partial [Blastocatellia bacterium]|nr:hypothetical protein [Blastocatellia bacterium]
MKAFTIIAALTLVIPGAAEPTVNLLSFRGLVDGQNSTATWDGEKGGRSDWPQWRGPQRNGISQERGLLKHWPAQGPKLLWQVNDIGDGYSTPAVVGTRIYLMSNRGMENEFVQ